MKILIPYTTLEEKQGIKDQYDSVWTLLGEDVRQDDRVLIYDDGTPPPFTIPDEVTRAGFLVLLGYLNEMEAGTYTPKNGQDMLDDVKARLGL